MIFNFLQLNCARCRLAMDELRRAATQRATILALLQEPFNVRSTFNALGLNTRVVCGPPPPTSRYGLLSLLASPMAAIAIFGRALDVLAVRDLSDSFIVVAQISLTPNLRIYFISVYIAPGADDLPFTRRLNYILSTLDTRFPVVIGGDFNAQSSFWHAPVDNPRGTLLAELFAGWDLTSLNTPNSGPSFQETQPIGCAFHHY